MTPDPQYTMGRLRSAPTAVKRARSSSGGRKTGMASAVRFPANGRLTAPGMWPARGSIGSVSPAIAVAGPGVDHEGRRVEARHLVPGDDPALARPRRESRRGRRHRAALQRPAFGLPLRDPAVEHRDRVVPERAQQVPEARRDGAGLIVVGDHARLGTDAGGADDRDTCSSDGQGWRPAGSPRPPPGADRSAPTSRKTAPGMWPAR